MKGTGRSHDTTDPVVKYKLNLAPPALRCLLVARDIILRGQSYATFTLPLLAGGTALNPSTVAGTIVMALLVPIPGEAVLGQPRYLLRETLP